MSDAAPDPDALPPPRLLPLGDGAALLRFADRLGETANTAAIGFARALQAAPPPGAVEIVPNLVSVLVRYDRAATDYDALAGELRLRLSGFTPGPLPGARQHAVAVTYGGPAGPDLGEVAEACGVSAAVFVDFHTAAPVRVLANGFAPGFVYCGLHPEPWIVPRRRQVRETVPAGAILFAAGQTAIAATAIRSGWSVIGQTAFRNFEPERMPPVTVNPGDVVHFEAVT